MIRRIRWRQSAVADLNELYSWIKERSDRHVAFAYTSAIEARANRLADAPHSGTARPDVSLGLRSVVYRRRTIIFYRVEQDHIAIMHIAHGGRDIRRMFDEDDD